MNCWTLDLIRKQRGRMTVPSILRYRSWVIRRSVAAQRPDGLLRLRLLSPLAGDVWLREAGSDFDTLGEIFEHQVYAPIARQASRCEFLIDLGANIGLATRYFASQFPGCRIFAVEPDPANFRLLERNAHDLVAAGRCTLARAAVWGRRVGLVADGPQREQARHDGISFREAAAGDAAETEALTVGDIIDRSGFPRVDVIKIDIEGAETAVFGGDLGWIGRVDAIAIEFHGQSRADSGFDAIMERSGFAACESNHHTVVFSRKT